MEICLKFYQIKEGDKMKLKKAGALGLSCVIALGSMAGCGSSKEKEKTDGKEEISGEIRYAFWDTTQQPYFEKCIEKFNEQYPDVKVTLEPSSWDEYWTKLEAGATGGSIADVFWMNGPNIMKYADGDVLMDISDRIKEDNIDTGKYPEALVELYNVDGKQYAIPKDFDTIGVWYNKKIFDEAGVPYPTDDWTWDDYITLNEKVAKSTGKPSALAATAGIFGDVNIFNYWVRSQGESLFNEDGTALGYDDDKITSDFFDMWKKMADDNVAPDADEQTQIASLGKEGLPIVTDEAATDIEWNAFPTTVSSANPNLKLAVMPNAKDSGLWLKPGMFFSVSETSKVKEECAKFINWFVNSNEANEILLGERGTPVSSDVRDNLIERDKLSEQQKEAFEYTDKVSAVVGETPAADPSGIAEVNEAFASAGNSVLYGQLTSKEAAKQFREKANAILERNNAQ